MNKIITASAISLIGLSVGLSNQSYAGGESMPWHTSIINNKSKVDESKESVKSQEDQGLVNLLKIEQENERSKIKYDYVFGLFLEFAEGNISIDELESEFKKKVIICKDKEQEAIKKDADKIEKLLAETTREVWEKFEKAITASKKRLQNKEVSYTGLQEEYKDKAIEWFGYRYGIQEKNAGSKSTDKKGKKASNGGGDME